MHLRRVGVLRLLPLKWRLLVAGCVVSIVAIVVMVVHGAHPFYFGLLGVGVALLIASAIWLLRTRRG